MLRQVDLFAPRLLERDDELDDPLVAGSASPRDTSGVKGVLDAGAPPTVGKVQHITNAEKSMLVGDEVAALLLDYAAALARVGSGDTVRVNAVSGDGNEVVATFLLNSGTVLMAETTNTQMPEPDNREAEEYLRDRLSRYRIDETDLLSLGEDGQQEAPD